MGRRQTKKRVSKGEWLDMALDILTHEGIEGVRIERLADRLGISKSGFYWHFRDRDDLYRQLLEAELPIQLNWVCGSNEESMHHCMMMSAGLNWHLFDTIDVIKHGNGETLYLPTSPLQNQNGTIYGVEQLPVPGVPMPEYEEGNFVSWGVVQGTDIGYVYVASWDPDPRLQRMFPVLPSRAHGLLPHCARHSKGLASVLSPPEVLYNPQV